MIRKGRRVSTSTLKRLCALYTRLRELSAGGLSRVTSFDLAERLCTSAASVRRDISTVGGLGPSPVGYEVPQLIRLLEDTTGLGRPIRLCVIGLDWLGEALVGSAALEGCAIVAGFDSNTNRLETARSRVPLFPTYEIENVVRREGIEIALLTSASQVSSEVAARLARGGVRGLLNLTGCSLGCDAHGLACSSVSILDELRYLSMLIHAEEESQ